MVLSASTIFLPSITTALKQLAFLVVWLWNGRFLTDQNHPPKSFGSYSPSSPLLHHTPTSYASIKSCQVFLISSCQWKLPHYMKEHQIYSGHISLHQPWHTDEFVPYLVQPHTT
ncbi:hypothetical protein FA13DRAFT_1832670 [Coprinellus micaceus]|uniref:Uncharacterized protein n=1 Tax=Coprinellus micaceus TaxID=71717 RepID=A0A4Y7SHP4_COPMI|nr:hypothetical protein FA13DRAFT_1832670 [Coprinellus micaceus]